jgi:tRNA-specific 2-thiouridylase
MNLTAVAISGGVDSMMAAYILKQQGHKVIGVHFITGYETDPERTDRKISMLADQLGINYKILDCRQAFESHVIKYFISSYLAGLTPNPCMICNPTIKFGFVFEYARQLGANRLATGHYARITKGENNRLHLVKGIDNIKDQSYFLARLTQKQLSCACFPLGDFTKQNIIQMAKENNLSPVTKGESQDICFIQNKTYGEFLISQAGFQPKHGLIEDVNGNAIGRHNGLHLFTIGQRRGINCPAAEPYYVVRLDMGQNRLVVGHKNDLLSSQLTAIHINWINRPENLEQTIYTRIRGRHQAQPSTLILKDSTTATIKFHTPQSSVTPGQGAVFYQNNEVLGGGWIAQDSYEAF